MLPIFRDLIIGSWPSRTWLKVALRQPIKLFKCYFANLPLRPTE